jgi:hypothetical protein
MDWTQTLTIILTISGSMLAALYAFYRISKEDSKRHDAEIAEVRREFSKTHALWADLLKQIHDIKLDHSGSI